jgi:alpha-galactosidase
MSARKAAVARAGDTLALIGPGVRIECDLRHGTLALVDERRAWRPLVAASAVELADGRRITSTAQGWTLLERPRRVADVHGRGVRALLGSDAAEGRLLLELVAYDARPFVLLRLGFEHREPEVARVARFVPLTSRLDSEGADGPSRGGGPFSAGWRFYRHGWQSWTPSLALSLAQRDITARPPVLAPAPGPVGRGRLASEEVSALFDPATGRSLLLGFVTARWQTTRIQADAPQRALEAVAEDGGPLAPGETRWSERLLVQPTDDASGAFDEYAGALAREMGARVPISPPTGWCTWYYYFWDVSEAEVLKHLAFLREHRRALPIEYVQIDDGYQAGIGDWTETNERFPHGMAWLAERIREAGFRPGLWLAPFLVGEQSRLYAHNPSWVVRDAQGAPVLAMRNWEQRCFALDCTHPEAEAWLRDLFRTVTEAWGYDYLRGLLAIREAAGGRFVLGCGALIGPSVGLVDAMRIGPDVAPWWRVRAKYARREPGSPRVSGEPSVEDALRNVLTRAWMHGRLWANDPDCLLARQTRTKLTLPEVQALATAIGLSGGAVIASDDLTQLAPERLDLVSLLLPPLGETPAVPDLLEREQPETMMVCVARPFETWWLIGRFNWQRRRRALAVRLPPGRWHVFDFWRRRYLGVHEGDMTVPDVPAHGVALLGLRRARATPQLLATTLHWSMGGREVEDARYDRRSETLRIVLQPVARQRGELFVVRPRSYRLLRAEVDGQLIERVQRQGNVLVVPLTVAERTAVRLRFRTDQ